jgi:hypothetical protein
VNSINPSAASRSGATSLTILTPLAADHGRIRRLDRAGKRDAFGDRDGMDERTPHAPAGAGDHQSHIGMCSSHRCFLGLSPVTAI